MQRAARSRRSQQHSANTRGTRKHVGPGGFPSADSKGKRVFQTREYRPQDKPKAHPPHQHVFGKNKPGTSAEILVQWEKTKAQEKAAAGKTSATVFTVLPLWLPALMFAKAVDKQTEKKKLPTDTAVDRKRISQLASQLTENTGRQFYELVAACPARSFDSEAALRRKTDHMMPHVEARIPAS